MTGHLNRPTVVGQISNSKGRLQTIERRLAKPPPKVPTYIAKWSSGGNLQNLGQSGYEMHPTGGNLVRWYVILVTPSSDDPVVISLWKNDDTVSQLTLLQSVTYAEAVVNIPVSPKTDLLSLSIEQSDYSAGGISVFGIFDT